MSNSTRPTATSTSSGPAGGYDERFVVPLEASRRGAHRARVSPLMAMLPILAVVGIVAAAVTLVFVFLGGSGSGGDSGSAAGPSPAATSSPSEPAQHSPSASPTSGASEGTSPTGAAGTVDKTLPVSVFNGTPTSGLAKKAGNKLTAAGWKLGEVASWTGTPVSVTTVYYGTEDQRASAQAVVKALGHGVAKMSTAKAGPGLSVVVASDFTGGTRGTTTGHSSSTGSSRSATKSSTTTSAKASAPTDAGGSPTDTASPAN